MRGARGFSDCMFANLSVALSASAGLMRLVGAGSRRCAMRGCMEVYRRFRPVTVWARGRRTAARLAGSALRSAR